MGLVAKFGLILRVLMFCFLPSFGVCWLELFGYRHAALALLCCCC